MTRSILAAACAAALVLPATAGAQDTLRALNALRAEHHLPADLTENRAWSAGCARHVEYLVRNQISNGFHPEAVRDERPDLPGYTRQGDEAAAGSALSLFAGTSAQIIAGVPWTADAPSPYETSPFDLQALLDPDLQTVGFADGCVRTRGGTTRTPPAAPTAFTYPGRDALVRPELPAADAFEGDITAPPQPGALAGLYGSRTGPGLIVWLSGAPGPVTGADEQLFGADGAPVPVRRIDATNPDRPANAPANALMLLPARPLAPRSEYVASVTVVAADGRRVPVVWTFRTDRRSVASTVRVEGVRPRGRDGRRAVLVIRGGNAVGRRVRISLAKGRTCTSGEGCVTQDLGPRRYRTVTLRKVTRVPITTPSRQTNITVLVPEFTRGDERIEERVIVSAVVVSPRRR